MTFLRMMLAIASATAVLLPLELHAQAPTTYTVGKGETVMTIAAKLRYRGASENQMAYAIVRRNPNAFSAKSQQRLKPGARLLMPDEATVLAYTPETADRGVTTLRKGETRYQDGLAAEKGGDMKGAVSAYIESARLGHPLADLRLGQLYDRDTSKTLARDLQQSIRHYQKAREFGIDVKGQQARDPGAPNVPVH